MQQRFFRPNSIAVIGASRDKRKIGAQVLANIQEHFRGAVYPVNPHARKIAGLPCYKSVGDIGEPVEMAVIVVPALFVNAVVEECGKKNIRSVVVISGGFGEMGEEGKQREEQLREICEKYHITLVGPNCLGFLYPAAGLNVSFGPELPREGNVALFSQSGAMAVALMDWAHRTTIGFSAIVSMGNKAVMDETMLLQWAERDPHTQVVLLYLESIETGTAFMEIAGRVAQKKPIILLKAGNSEAGSKAIVSHTGKIAGDSAVFEAYCADRGVVRVRTIEELFDAAELFARHRKCAGNRVAVVTNAGGPGVLATDEISGSALRLASLSAKTTLALRSGLPPSASTVNPIDMLGDATHLEYTHTIRTLCESGEVDMISVLLTPQTVTDVVKIARHIVQLQQRFPNIPMVTSFIGGERVAAGIEVLERHDVVHYEFPHRSMQALNGLWRYAQVDGGTLHRPGTQILGLQGVLPLDQVKKVMKGIGYPLLPSRLLHSEQDIAALSRSYYPMVLKVDNTHLLHKTEQGGVVISLETPEMVKKAFLQMKKKLSVPYLIAEKMSVELSISVFVGCKRSSYGDVMVVGLGGIYAELFQDHCLIPAPLTAARIKNALQPHLFWKILSGYRGQLKGDTRSMVRCLTAVGKLFASTRDIETIDINPLFVLETGVVPIDVKIIME